jgi:ligand-binding sensor domain-containing protein
MNFFCKSGTFCLLILFGVNQSSNAQNESLRFEHIGIEEGLSNNKVKAILQDRKGYLWFGTMDGLNKYDGYSFTKYQFDPFDSSSLSQNTIYTIWEDKYGSIWVGTYAGLCRFDRSTEKFTRYKPDEKAKFSDPNISAINEDNDGMMWVAGISSGLCRFDRQTGMFLPDSFDLTGVSCIYKDRAGVLWVGSPTGLYRLNLSAKKAGALSKVSFTPYQHDPDNPYSLSNNRVTSVFEDRHGIIWVATDNGLNSLDRETGIFKHYQNDPKNIHSISSNNFAGHFGNTIKEDQQGNLWIATDKGLNKLNPDRTSFTSYFHNPDDANSLSINTVISLHIDSAGVLYAGCWGGKLDKANLNPKSFELRRHDPGNINSLSNNAVTTILEDSSGIIWIGTYGGGLNRWNRRTNQFIHFRHNPSNPATLKSDTIFALLEDLHGHIWVCNGDVLSKLKNQNGEFIHYYSNVNNYKDVRRFIFSITKDREGFLWLGTSNGLKRFEEKTGEFKHHYYNPANTNGISDYGALTVFADSRDNIWVGYGSRATDRYDKRTDSFFHYKHDPKDSASISSSVVNCIFEDSKGNLWLGTLSGGVCYFDYQKGKFTTFTAKHGLPANNVYSVVSDNKGQLWLGTSNGLSRLDPGTKRFTNYDDKDGLQSNVFVAGDGTIHGSKGTCLKASDGTLYFGGNNGFNFFDPQQLKPDSQIAPVVITQFKLFDSLIKGANELKEIVLKHNQNYFSFEFSSLSYYNPSKNQYRYKLEGVDEEWINSGSRHYVAYTNIDPGTYTFKVKGTNNDGVWNEEGTYVSIIIKPPWWKTLLFRIVAALFVVASFYGLIRWRLQQKFRLQLERSEKERQLAELNQKGAELEMQALRAQMNPHFIFNSLNSINRFILQNNKAQASEYLTKFSKLVRMILQNSQESLITLESELESLKLYLELEAVRFEHRFDFNFSVPKNLETDVLKVPPLIIQPYVENAIWHGLMHKEEKGHLSIDIEQNNDDLLLKITDDGIGRKKASQLASKSATRHKSMGLRITADRISILKRNGNESTVTINDLVNPDGTAAGTEVIIKMPVVYE